MKKMKEIFWLLAIVLLACTGYYLYQCKVEHTSQIASVKIQNKSSNNENIDNSKLKECLTECPLNCFWAVDSLGKGNVGKCRDKYCSDYCKKIINENYTFDESKFKD